MSAIDFHSSLPGLPVLAARLRVSSLRMIHAAASGHPGGALSAADLVAYLYARELRFDPRAPDDPDRDRFILSKGHACPILYAAAAELGMIARSQLLSLRKLGSPLQGHPHVGAAAWVETSTGSLGQGFSVAIGMAMGLRYQQRQARVYVMLGDGELQEGEVWEATMCAAHYGLDNLCAILDYNGMQSDDTNRNVMNIEPVAAKFQAFGWHTVEIDGHDFAAIENGFTNARDTGGQPTMLIARTVKGKGISYMEGSPLWHGSVRLRDDELAIALSELGPYAEENG